MSLRICDCGQFDGVDPAEKPPNDRHLKLGLHYVRHGPIQPADGFERNADGRSFRAEWYLRFPAGVGCTSLHMIAVIGAEIQRAVARRASDAGMFTVMMDETTDVSHKEQVAIYVRPRRSRNWRQQ